MVAAGVKNVTIYGEGSVPPPVKQEPLKEAA
jgi:hypothetical protein